MTTDHAAALDGAVQNLIDNRLTVPQILELVEVYASDTRIFKESDSGTPFSKKAYGKMVASRTDLEAALAANMRPRP